MARKGRDIAAAEALDFVAGYCIGLDTVLGPWLVTADEIPDPNSLDIRIEVNGKERQKANTRDLILGVSELIAWASSFYTLHPGDVLLTGTPLNSGSGPEFGFHVRKNEFWP